MFTHIQAFESVPEFERKKGKIAYHTPYVIIPRGWSVSTEYNLYNKMVNITSCLAG